jgi:hypothetical protein
LLSVVNGILDVEDGVSNFDITPEPFAPRAA